MFTQCVILSATSSNDTHKCTQAALRWPAQTGLNYTENLLTTVGVKLKFPGP